MKQSKQKLANVKIDKRIDRVRSKNPLTVEKFLQGSDVSELLEEIHDNRAEITELICVYLTDDGYIHWKPTKMEESKAVWLLEQTKLGILRGDNDD